MTFGGRCCSSCGGGIGGGRPGDRYRTRDTRGLGAIGGIAFNRDCGLQWPFFTKTILRRASIQCVGTGGQGSKKQPDGSIPPRNKRKWTDYATHMRQWRRLLSGQCVASGNANSSDMLNDKLRAKSFRIWTSFKWQWLMNEMDYVQMFNNGLCYITSIPMTLKAIDFILTSCRCRSSIWVQASFL